MSADYFIEDDNYNVTYNLGPMLRAAGFPDWGALTDAPTTETGGMLRTVAARLRANPDEYRTLNPPNGWGNYECALRFLDSFADGCAQHPQATIRSGL